ncbi:MAG: P-loop NTPase fold protein [Akkermansia sp.]|nr:P-loop NTPase fold protein [Akkermansia sp.]
MDESLNSDIFHRESIAKTMCKYIVETSTEIISPIVLDGPWGSGKTTHAERIRECFLREYNDTVKCIYWNASFSDYALEPLPMFVATLYDSISEEKKADFAQRAFDLCCGWILGATMSVGTQVLEATVGVNCKQLINDSKNGAAIFDKQSKLKSQFNSFLETAGNEQNRIETARALIQLAKSEKRELIIIIDELDRCRPDFALKMIEIIKHLFDENGCKFILVMNKSVICRAIESLYGLNADESENYLSKYIKTDFQLPRSIYNRYLYKLESCSELYFYELLKTDKKNNWECNELLNQLVSFVINKKSLQFREVEKWVRMFRFMQSVVSKDEQMKINNMENYVDCFICFFSYIHAFYPDYVIGMFTKQVNVDLIFEAIGCETTSNRGFDFKEFESINYVKCILDFYFEEADKIRIINQSDLKGYEFFLIGENILKQCIELAIFLR